MSQTHLLRSYILAGIMEGRPAYVQPGKGSKVQNEAPVILCNIQVETC